MVGKGRTVDILSILLSVIGWEKDRASKVSDRRVEAARLNAEVAGEAARAVDMLNFAMPRILKRCAELCPDQPELVESCAKTLDTMRANAMQICAQSEGIKEQIASAGSSAEWDKLVSGLHEWRVTASRFVPEADRVIRRYEEVLDTEAARREVG
ncbi:hypothetical protein CDO24_04310 [Sinorhizobium meliloti]|nr:hypothetical protein CDO24_04310 [Sinorhizobium meliloti]